MSLPFNNSTRISSHVSIWRSFIFYILHISFRTWDEYSRGFGDVLGEFYLGNEPIHMVTHQRPYELRVELVGWNSKIYHSNYDDFAVCTLSPTFVND